jgi:aryl-alcohol dehydrogenase-like predicted oxidoreductase
MASAHPIPGAPKDRILLALGFTLSHDEVDTAIVGTRNLDYLMMNIDWIENDLPISLEAVEELHRRFARLGRDWIQLT